MLWGRKIPSYRFLKPNGRRIVTDRTEGSGPFQVVDLDFAGPIGYKIKTKKEGKTYILLFACSLNRAVHLKLLANRTTEEFIKHLKRLITKEATPRRFISSNGRTFVAAANWLNGVVKRVLLICFSQSKMSRWIQSYVKFDVSKKSNKLS